MAEDIEVRPMRKADLDTVLEIMNGAFAELMERTTGRTVQGPLFASILPSYRLALDPAGCHVATGGDEILGANFSVLRGTLAWFGPLAVRPDAQRRGIAQRLVRECIRSAEQRGARLIGLETIANSPLHINLYHKLGFRSSWTGLGYYRAVRRTTMPADVEVDGAIPRLDYVYRGYDATKDAHATRSENVGVTLTCGDGLAICHLRNTLWPDTIAYVPLIAAPDRQTFDKLVTAIDAVAAERDMNVISTQVAGSSWHTQAALHEHGYAAQGASLRMKRGEQLDYDAGTAYYCDDWH